MKKIKRIPKVTAVEVMRPFALRVTFDDGLVRDVEFEPDLRGPLFEPLRDPAYFAQVFIDDGTLAWPNGLDLDPLVLHGDFEPTQREPERGTR